MSGCISTSTVTEFKMILASILLSYGGGLVLGYYHQELFGEKYGLFIAMLISIVWGIFVSAALN